MRLLQVFDLLDLLRDCGVFFFSDAGSFKIMYCFIILYKPFSSYPTTEQGLCVLWIDRQTGCCVSLGIFESDTKASVSKL